jgi:hypothetical protein
MLRTMKNALEQRAAPVAGNETAESWPEFATQQQRDPEDDFYCLRYRVWYPSFDCAYRTRHRTAPGCRDCEQGRFNLKRHAAALVRSTALRLG